MNDEDMLNELTGNTPQQQEIISPIVELIPNTIYLSDRNLKLGQMIGPITKKLGKSAFEVGGFYILKMGDDSFKYTDFIVPKELTVSFGSIRIDENYDAAAREIDDLNAQNRADMRLGAMFHIHPGEVGGLSHSLDDDHALKNLTNKMAKTTRRIYEAPFSLIESTIEKEYGKDMTCLKGDALSDAIVRFYYPDDQLFNQVLSEFGLQKKGHLNKSEFLARLLDIIDEKTSEPRSINFALSFVFNNGGDMPFVKMGVEETFKLSGKTNYVTVEGFSLEIINKGINCPKNDEVTELVKSRVVFPKWYGHGKGRKYRPLNIANQAGYEYHGFTGQVNSYNQFLQSDWYNNRGIPFNAIPNSADLSVAEKIDKIVVDSKLPIGKSSFLSIQKSKDEMYTYSEIVTQFVLEAFSYVSLCRHGECKYSTYMATLLEKASAYVPQAGVNNMYNVTVAIQSAYAGLNSSIRKTGPLVMDNPEVVEKHLLKTYSLDKIVSNIVSEVSDFKNEIDPTLGFMWGFIQSDMDVKNQLLESYIASILEEPKKIETK